MGQTGARDESSRGKQGLEVRVCITVDRSGTEDVETFFCQCACFIKAHAVYRSRDVDAIGTDTKDIAVTETREGE
jgi:hypothetical protein